MNWSADNARTAGPNDIAQPDSSAANLAAAQRVRQENLLAVRNVKLQLKDIRERMFETRKTAESLQQLLQQLGLQRKRPDWKAEPPEIS